MTGTGVKFIKEINVLQAIDKCYREQIQDALSADMNQGLPTEPDSGGLSSSLIAGRQSEYSSPSPLLRE